MPLRNSHAAARTTAATMPTSSICSARSWSSTGPFCARHPASAAPSNKAVARVSVPWYTRVSEAPRACRATNHPADTMAKVRQKSCTRRPRARPPRRSTAVMTNGQTR